MLTGARNPLRSPWNLPSRWFGGLLSLALFLGVTTPGRAIPLPLTQFNGLVRTLATGGAITLAAPGGIALGLDGSIFIADTGTSRIVKLDPWGTASVATLSGLATPLSGPTALALDGAGNLYIADTGNNRVVKLAANGAGTVVATGSVVLNAPRGVALDPSGDLFIADSGNGQIVEVTSGGSAAALAITVASGSAALNAPAGLAVNAAGKLFIADSLNHRVVSVAAGSTSGAVLSLPTVTLVTPKGVALDAVGNVYIADSGANQVAEVDRVGNDTVLPMGSVTLSGPAGVAVDARGILYLADTGNNRGLVVNPLLVADPASDFYTSSLNKSAVDFGHVQLGSAAAVTLTLPVNIGTGKTVGSVKVFTRGTQGLDFRIGADSALAAGATNGASSVDVSFLPTAAGLRTGALVVYDNATPAAPILTLPLSGFSDAPLAALSPNLGSVLNTGGLATANPYQLAVDGAGTMYIGVYSGSNVTKVAAGGGTGSASLVALGTPGGLAVRNITGVAIDPAGNLFIGDHQNSRILVVTPAGVVSVLTITGLPAALGFPTALAFDPAGDLFIADFSNGKIIEVSSLHVSGATSSGLGSVRAFGTYAFGSGNLTGLCVDPAGTLYAAARTQNASHIVKVTAAGIASVLDLSAVSPAVNNPQGVAADSFGNVYVVDTTNNRIVRVTSTGATQILAPTGLPSPATTLGPTLFGVTIDPGGNLYIMDWSNNRIVLVNVNAAALAFASTRQGQTSSDSPKAATAANLGNQTLVLGSDPTYTADFSANGADPNPLTASTSLLPGTAANVSVKFTPQSTGSLSAAITVTDNSLNVAGSTQQVAVSGISINPGDSTGTSVVVSPTPTIYAGQAATVTATVADTTTGHTSTLPTGSVSFTDTLGSTTTSLGTASLSGGVASLAGVILSGIGNHTLTATYAGVNGTFLTSSGTRAVALAAALPATVALASSAPGTGYAGQAVTFTATVSDTFGSTPTGSVDFLDGTTLLGSVTLAGGSAAFTTSSLALGDHSITAAYGGFGPDAAARSSVLDQVVATPAVVVTTPPPAAVAGPDGTASTTLTLSSLGTLGAPVTFTVSGLPAATTISFDNEAVTIAGAPVVVNVTLHTTPRLRIIGQNLSGPYGGLGAGALLGCGILALPFARRKRRFGIFLSALALLLAGGMTACTSSNGSKGITTGAAGTPAGSYTVSVTASAQGATGVTSTIQLTVN